MNVFVEIIWLPVSHALPESNHTKLLCFFFQLAATYGMTACWELCTNVRASTNSLNRQLCIVPRQNSSRKNTKSHKKKITSHKTVFFSCVRGSFLFIKIMAFELNCVYSNLINYEYELHLYLDAVSLLPSFSFFIIVIIIIRLAKYTLSAFIKKHY